MCKGNKVVVAGDGKVAMGQTIMKHGAKKIRRLAGSKVIAGFDSEIEIKVQPATNAGGFEVLDTFVL